MLASKLSKKPVEEKFAEAILAVALGGLATISPVAGVIGIVAAVGAGHYLFRKKDFNREVVRLRKKGYIALTKTEDGWKLKLLDKGRQRYRAIELAKLRLRKPNSWDGKWRLFIFDVPEEFRSARNAMRKKMKELGLYNIQRSVLAYPYDCRTELDFIATYYGLEKYATYVETSFIDIDRELRKFFQI